jgi:hypothetical protein
VEGSTDFDLVAASLRADADDLRVFAEALTTKLEQSLPGRCHVERSGLLGHGDVRRITVDLGANRFELVRQGESVSTRRSSVVRGVTLKSEELGLDEWIDELAAELVQEADRSERGRIALERLLDA